MKSIFALVVWLLSPIATLAQIIKPITWTFSAAKSTVKVGEVIRLNLTATIKSGYHIYSSVSNPKIEGPLPTAFSFHANKTYELIGQVKPVSQVKTKYEEVFEGDTYLMHGMARFVQMIRILAPQPQISGMVSYQVCTDDDGECISGEEDFVIRGLSVLAASAPAVVRPPVKH
ncbi:protein-disulfide reductase DsbD domain-containing protein [Spirosoma utsteinense]|uniref:Thiol:disulfide interchange protein DsbD N-terminal domain-containing protein n=1 Tax=Spirosoma utsteinense TaxID=2585773 RepID=A0ABR6WE55_9BACT|nr:protein-disulfide reductase DsbD domain-containing protein [Spirosoma utsteinense]MBC3788922.1 hypothetical protein [Spirosoma utsteinense]MBC3794840.1 hypothetical protein [Spirosoma utsteinense]